MPAKRSKTTKRPGAKKTTRAPKRTARKTQAAPRKTTAKRGTKAPTKAKKTPKTATKTPRKTPRRATPKTARAAGPDGLRDPNSITVQPMLAVPDVEAELRFLEAMGFQTVMKMPGPGGATIHAVVMMDNGLIHVDPVQMPDMPGMPPLPPGPLADRVEQAKRGPLGLGISIYVMVGNVDKIHKALRKQNAPIVQPPMDMFWGDRTVMAYDPAGYLWQFAQHIKDVAPEDMGKAMEQMMPAM